MSSSQRKPREPPEALELLSVDNVGLCGIAPNSPSLGTNCAGPWLATPGPPAFRFDRCDMAIATFICPETTLEVQAWFADHPDYSRPVYQPIECIACDGVHFIDPKTGEILMTEAERRGLG